METLRDDHGLIDIIDLFGPFTALVGSIALAINQNIRLRHAKIDGDAPHNGDFIGVEFSIIAGHEELLHVFIIIKLDSRNDAVI